MSEHSFFDKVPEAPEDPIFGLNNRFKADTHPNKINLGIGAYRDENGQPWVLPVVRKVEQQLAADTKQNKEYLDIGGLKEFCDLSVGVILGKEFASANANRIAAVQAVSGTGAVRLGAEFLARFMPGRTVYISKPTWGNHNAIFKDCKIEFKEYRYWNPKTNGLDLDGLLQDLEGAADGSIILLHACAHNPTGVDPSIQQWQQILNLMKKKRHVPFFDSAYQGFASGDLDKDAAAVRLFAQQGMEILVCQSYAKNFGLYAERAGCLSVLCANQVIAKAVSSQLKTIVRPMYSNPPKHGALIVATVLGNPDLYKEWVNNLQEMSGRIIKMRETLFNSLKEKGTPGDWSHIVNQIGMFSFTGLTVPQVNRLVEEFHIYLLQNGRISMAGLNSKNVGYLAEAIHKAVTNT